MVRSATQFPKGSPVVHPLVSHGLWTVDRTKLIVALLYGVPPEDFDQASCLCFFFVVPLKRAIRQKGGLGENSAACFANLCTVISKTNNKKK